MDDAQKSAWFANQAAALRRAREERDSPDMVAVRRRLRHLGIDPVPAAALVKAEPLARETQHTSDALKLKLLWLHIDHATKPSAWR